MSHTVVTAKAAADQLAIMECLSRYAWGYDARDLDMLGGVFADDAILSMELKDGEAWGPYVGRVSIVDWIGGFMKIQSDRRCHNMTNFIFDELTSVRATVRCFLVLTAAERGRVRLVTTGSYRVEAVKLKKTWRIAKLHLLLDAPF